jgi:hypothetical protein
MPETLKQQRLVNFLGREVGAREAALLASILRRAWRNAWRKAAVGEGVPEASLARCVGKQKTDEMWKVAIQRCVNWGWVELVRRSDSVNVVELTPLGRQHAEYLCGLSGLPVDGIEELMKEGEV